jgi:CBS domain-containing protein
MALRVREIMNPELFSVGPEESVETTLAGILALGITGVPVVNGQRKPVGLVSLRDLVGDRPGATAGERMTRPPVTVPAEARIREAAGCLARTGYHRLIVVDDLGRAVGMVSSLDVIRGLLGLPAPHPASFPHLDRETGLSWTDERPLELAEIGAAPEGPGVLMLLHGGAEVPERVVWAESSESVRSRLREMLAAPQPDLLAAWLEHGSLLFRAASAGDPAERAEALAAVLQRAVSTPRPDDVSSQTRATLDRPHPRG